MFTKDDTLALKGVAIELMLLHHLAAFPDRWPVGFGGFSSWLPGFVEKGYLADFAMNSLLCVPLFFFLGGYGLFRRRAAGRADLAEDVWRLYRRFWRVFFLLIPIGFLFFARSGEGINPLCTRFVLTDGKSLLRTLLLNFTGYDTNLNGEWWFLGSYLCALPLGYLFCRATDRARGFLPDMFAVFCLDILTQGVFPGLAGVPGLTGLGSNLYFRRFCTVNKYMTAFFAGVVFARYDALARLKRAMGRLAHPGAAALAGMAVLFLCRAYVLSDVANGDILLAPLFALCCSVCFDRTRRMKALAAFLGRHSANMWLTHSFFCFYFLEFTQVVYCSRSVWLDLAVLTGLSLAASAAVDGLYRGLALLGREAGARREYALNRPGR